ncbi:MAG: ABC transporter substrate-binding protein [Syntrophales bacterium]|nr:ABC transporter substrate-binding protein [Syntrophales bacterium]
MRKVKTFLAVCIVLSLSLFIQGNVACADQSTKEITFAGLSALSGGASPWGIPIQRALVIGFDKVNEEGGFNVNGQKYKWNLVTYDHKYVPAEAVKALHRAIYSDGATFALVQGGAQPLACLPSLQKNNILSLNPSSAVVIKKEYPLSFNYNPSIVTAYASLLPFFMKSEGVKTIASINRDDDGGRAASTAMEMIAGINGIKIIASEYVESETKDFTSVLTKVVAAKPDLIETGYSSPTACVLIAKQARELGYKGVLWLTWGPDVDQVIKMAGPAAEKAYLGLGGPLEPQSPIEKDLYKRFIQRYPASEWAGNSSSFYNPAWLPTVLTAAIEKCQSLDSMTVADTLEDMSWEGPQGRHAFGGMKLYGIKRQLLRPITLVQIQNKKAVWITDEPVPPGVLD